MALTLDKIEAAIEAILDGAQSYTVGDTTYTRADLDKLKALRRELRQESLESSGNILQRTFTAIPRRSY